MLQVDHLMSDLFLPGVGYALVLFVVRIAGCKILIAESPSHVALAALRSLNFSPPPADTVLYLVIGLYLDAVLPRAIGRRLHPCFCFFPSFWTGKPRKNKLKAPITADEHKQAEGQDDDVYHEGVDYVAFCCKFVGDI